MKKLIIAFCGMLIIWSCSTKVIKNADDLVFKDGTFYSKDDTTSPFTGNLETFYADGKPEYLTSYKDGNRNGEDKEWYQNGILRRSGFYIDGKPDGVHIIYHEDGTINKIDTFKNGERIGLSVEYHRNKISRTGRYRNDTKDGEWIVRDSTGKKLAQQVFNKGNLHEIVRYYPDGNVMCSCIKEKEGYCKFYDENGNRVNMEGKPLFTLHQLREKLIGYYPDKLLDVLGRPYKKGWIDYNEGYYLIYRSLIYDEEFFTYNNVLVVATPRSIQMVEVLPQGIDYTTMSGKTVYIRSLGDEDEFNQKYFHSPTLAKY